MVKARTVKTLIALLAAMTAGSLALVMMETAPIRPNITHLAAVASPVDAFASAISQTDHPIQARQWRNIIIYGEPAIRNADQCHFILSEDADPSGSGLRVTRLWRDQSPGSHAFVGGHDYNARSIAVYLAGDMTRRGPSVRQVQAVVRLVRTLQQTCEIPAARVYLYRDLDPQSGSPGAQFPVGAFAAGLLD